MVSTERENPENLKLTEGQCGLGARGMATSGDTGSLIEYEHNLLSLNYKKVIFKNFIYGVELK
jgi:hypothetical protein